MKKAIRIALADDHKLVRSGISIILNNQPDYVVVLQASNGKELLDKLGEARPDVILLDLEMPILGGRETLIKIRDHHGNIPVLILTMHQNDAFIIQMMELGANGYLLKDTEPEEVVNAVEKVLESGFYFSEHVSLAMLQGLSNHRLREQDKLQGHGLSDREIDVLRLICEEMTTAEIGERLFLSPKTIEGYRKLLMEKTNSRNMAGLVLFAVKHKLISY